MEKYVVNYKIAQLCADLGFDEACFYTYHKPVDQNPILEGANDYLDCDDKFFTEDHVKTANENNHHCILAPFRDQVITWLREKYNLSVEIYNIDNKWDSHVYHIADITPDDSIFDGQACDNFEETFNITIIYILNKLKNDDTNSK